MKHGSTDLPLHGIAFAMQGIDNFMGPVMNLDNQDIVGKMEGFTMNGICSEFFCYYFMNMLLDLSRCHSKSSKTLFQDPWLNQKSY